MVEDLKHRHAHLAYTLTHTVHLAYTLTHIDLHTYSMATQLSYTLTHKQDDNTLTQTHTRASQEMCHGLFNSYVII